MTRLTCFLMLETLTLLVVLCVCVFLFLGSQETAAPRNGLFIFLFLAVKTQIMAQEDTGLGRIVHYSGGCEGCMRACVCVGVGLGGRRLGSSDVSGVMNDASPCARH